MRYAFNAHTPITLAELTRIRNLDRTQRQTEEAIAITNQITPPEDLSAAREKPYGQVSTCRVLFPPQQRIHFTNCHKSGQPLLTSSK